MIRAPYPLPGLLWVSSFYDYPLAGLARLNGQFYRFEADYVGAPDWPSRYRLYELEGIEKIRWLLRKWLFEICVGKHMTYRNGRRLCYYQPRRPRILHHSLMRLYYATA